MMKNWKDLDPFEWVIITISLAVLGAVISVVLNSGSFKQLPIEAVSCEAIQTPVHLNEYCKTYYYLDKICYNNQIPKINTKDCYKVSDVLALNKALKLTDAVSLVTLLVTLFAVAFPLFAFFSLKREKAELKSKIEKDIEKTIDRDFSLLISNKLKLITSIAYIESFKAEYLSNFPNKQSEVGAIAIDLYRLMTPESNITELLVDIESFFQEELIDNISGYSDLFKALRMTLSKMYETGVFDKPEDKEALAKFSTNIFKLPLETMLRL